jgi:hypothetical protein
MFKFLLFFSFTLTCTLTIAQVTVTKDARIDELIRQAAPIVSPHKVPTIVGYRIQLVFDADKATVENLRMKFISLYPKTDTYVVFNAPNYFLKAGDYRTKLETDRVLKSIQSQFPTAFIIKERIYLPRIDQ